MISCPKCGKENQDHYKFCLGCGNELPREGGASRPFHPTPPAGVAAAAGPAASGGAAAAPASRAGGAPFGGPASGPSPFGGGGGGAMSPAPSPFGGPPPVGGPAPSPFGGPPPAGAGAPGAGLGASAPAAGPKPAAVCPACGAPNPRGNRFCITCGADTTSGAGAGPSQPAPPSPVAAASSPFGAPPSGGPGAMSVPAAPSPFGGAPPSAPSPFGGAPPAPVSAPSAGGTPSRASLVLIRPDGTEGGSFQLNEGATLIGRETGPLFASDNYLSPRHATFTVNGSTVSVRDENALNGVYVRIERQAPTEIRDNDVFRIGQEILRYEAFRPVQSEGDGTEKQGSQIEGLVGRISLVVGRDVTGNAFPIPVTGLFLGRERGDILFPEDGYVSGLHCQLSVEGGKLMLTDVGSSNGTYVRIRGERTVRNSDLLLMGQQLFRLTM